VFASAPSRRSICSAVAGRSNSTVIAAPRLLHSSVVYPRRVSPYNTPMTFRWLIRSFAIALLTLCLSVWTWSYFRSIYREYCSSFPKAYVVQTHMGGASFHFGDVHASRSRPLPTGWYYYYLKVQPLPSFPGDIRFLGFAYCEFNGRSWLIGIPFWFPSLLSAGLLWLVWRLTRPKFTGQGFPVEVTPPNPTT